MDKKQVTDFAENLTENLSEKLKEAFEKLENQDDVKAMKETAKEVADVASDFIRKYPIQTVVGAIAVGYILGSLSSRRRSP